MKILVDAYTPPDIVLYESIKEDLEKKHHNFIIISPNVKENIDLLKKKNLDFALIGLRSAMGLPKKIVINILRILSLMKFIKHEEPDLCISRSASSVIAAYLFRVPVAMFIDNDAAALSLLLTFPFASRIFMPKAIDNMGVGIPNTVRKKTFFYDGIEEMIYSNSHSNPKEDPHSILSISKSKGIIVFRPFAPYTEFEKSKKDHIMNLLVKLCKDEEIKNKYHLIVLPRNEEQKKNYQSKFKDIITVPSEPLDGPSLLQQTDIFVGAGGTMTREAWVFGTTAISMYSGRPLSVERYLTEKGEGYFKTTDMDKIVKLIKTHHEKENDRSNPNLKNEIIERIAKITEVER